jgi:hypothetical protein
MGSCGKGSFPRQGVVTTYGRCSKRVGDGPIRREHALPPRRRSATQPSSARATHACLENPLRTERPLIAAIVNLGDTNGGRGTRKPGVT